MKNLFLVLMVMLSFNVHSAAGIIKGNVQYVRVHDSTQHGPAWAPPIFWFTLETGELAGNCPRHHGKPLFVMDSDHAFSIVMAAYMSGQEVSVRYDDNFVAPTAYCKGTFITIGNPPPLN